MAKIVEVDVITTQRIRETYRLVLDCDIREFRRDVEHDAWIVFGGTYDGVPTDSTLVDTDFMDTVDVKFMSFEVVDPDYRRGNSDE